MNPKSFYATLAPGVTVATLPFTPITNSLIISLNGLVQTPGLDYAITGPSITFLALDPGDTPTVTANYWTCCP